jgi:hypothetical protein
MQAYTTIPTLAKWQSDSSVALAVRNSDTVLSRIDFLVSAFNGAPASAGRGIVCDLYFSIDYWLKYVKTNRNMEKRREPAMMALYKCVVDFLCGLFNCPLNALPRELDMMFGRELSEGGFRTDFGDDKAQYLERKELDNYKLWFKGGLAYQWTSQRGKSTRKPMSSASVHNAASFVTSAEDHAPNLNYGQFILTMGRDLYMARHTPGEEDKFNGFYHSSYVAGQAVMAAGSMLIESGRVRRIRSDSGHYRPVDTNMMSTLRALQMVGAPIHDVIIENFTGKKAVPAPEFWAANADWGKLKESSAKNEALRKKLHGIKKGILDTKRQKQSSQGKLKDPPYGGDDGDAEQNDIGHGDVKAPVDPPYGMGGDDAE